MDIPCRNIENNNIISKSIHALRLSRLCHIEKCGNENVGNFNVTTKVQRQCDVEWKSQIFKR